MNETEFNDRTLAMEARMYRVARSMLRADCDCADAVQQAVFTAWRKLDRVRDEERFEAWLMRVLVNCCRDIQRGYKRRRGETALEDAGDLRAPSPPDIALRAALDALPEKFRLPVLLHHMDGLPVKETARALSIPATTATWRIHEGLIRLRELLKEDMQ